MPHTYLASRRPWRRTRLVIPVVAALLTAACGAGNSTPGARDSDATSAAQTATERALKVAWTTLPDEAVLLLGVEKGFFERQGLDIGLVKVSGNTELVTDLLNGKAEISVSSGPIALTAISNDVPIKIVAGTTTFQPGPSGGTGTNLVVKKGSPITSPSDLAGKTVAVNQLKSASEYGVRQWVSDNGGDGTTVKFVEIPFQSMTDAVASGRVDAAEVADPYLRQALATGSAPFDDPMTAVFGDAPRVVQIAAASWSAKNGEVIKKFQRGMVNAAAYAADPRHLGELRAIFTKYLRINADAARKISIPRPSGVATSAQLGALIDLLGKYGALKSNVTASQAGLS